MYLYNWCLVRCYSLVHRLPSLVVFLHGGEGEGALWCLFYKRGTNSIYGFTLMT